MKKIIVITLMSMIFSFAFPLMPIKAADVIGVKEITTVSADDLPQGPNLPEGPGYRYLPEHSGQEVKIRIQQNGIFYIRISGEGRLIDGNHKVVPEQWTEEGEFYIKDVKKGEVFYLDFPEIKDSVFVTTYVYSDNVFNVVKNRLYVQSGQGKYTYKYFSVSNRSAYRVSVSPLFSDYKTNAYFYMQRKEKAGWKNISSKQTAEANEHGKYKFDFGLKKGKYRIATKTKVNQIIGIKLTGEKNTSKYQTKKSKAQKIKLGTKKTNIYTDTEKTSRYYRVYRKTAKKKRYLKVRSDVTSGRIKIRIYKKGSGRCLKSMTLKPTQTKTYRLKNGKGTYYVKVSKTGSKMSGKYTIQYK